MRSPCASKTDRQRRGAGLFAANPHKGHRMLIRPLILLGAILASGSMVLSTQAQQRASRVALIIGNASYPDASVPLSTTLKDVRTISEELRRGEFDVDLKENLGKDEMQRAIDAFAGKIHNGTAALFYFSGYGIQVARQTYLIPINAQIWSEADLRRDAFSVDALLSEMNRKGAKVKIVIIDAARRNPFERRFRTAAAGLGAIDAPDGTLAMYSAAPGKVIDESSGANSIFVGELIKELRVPSLTAEEVFNRARVGVSRATNNDQVPWVSSSLIEEFFFAGSRAAARDPSPAPMARTTPAPAPPPAVAPAPPPRPAPAPPVAAAPPVSAPSPAPPSSSQPVSSETKPGESFRDCQGCGEMVVVPAGTFDMGSNADYESPVHRVSFAKPFAIGRYEVTFDEWDRCVEEKGCKAQSDDRQWGRGDRPVMNVSWIDAKAFTAWLSQKTGQTYRLPSEAEWEYAARGGTNSPFWWGRDVGSRQANCRECGTGASAQTSPVGSYKPNPFGLYDTAGNVAEWVEDCWNDSYRGAPKDGSPWTAGQCGLRVLRGGAYDSQAKIIRSTARFRYDTDVRYSSNGFRVVRELQ